MSFHFIKERPIEVVKAPATVVAEDVLKGEGILNLSSIHSQASVEHNQKTSK